MPYERGKPIFAYSVLLLAGSLIVACEPQVSNSLVEVGKLDGYQPNSVTTIELAASFLDPDPPAIGSATPGVITQPASQRVSPIPVFLIIPAHGVPLVLYARDPYLGCQIHWFEAIERFEDPCHGSRYSMTGEWESGLSPRNLDQFAVRISEEGVISVDVSYFQLGEQHP